MHIPYIYHIDWLRYKSEHFSCPPFLKRRNSKMTVIRWRRYCVHWNSSSRSKRDFSPLVFGLSRLLGLSLACALTTTLSLGAADKTRPFSICPVACVSAPVACSCVSPPPLPGLSAKRLLSELYCVYCWYWGWKLWIASVMMSRGFIVSLKVDEMLCMVTFPRIPSRPEQSSPS